MLKKALDTPNIVRDGRIVGKSSKWLWIGLGTGSRLMFIYGRAIVAVLDLTWREQGDNRPIFVVAAEEQPVTSYILFQLDFPS